MGEDQELEEINRSIYNHTSVYTAMKFSRINEIILKIKKPYFSKTKQTNNKKKKPKDAVEPEVRMFRAMAFSYGLSLALRSP